MIVHPYAASELARVLHGIRPGSTILLAGEAGVGKSTVAAELAAAVAEARSGLAYWLDRDQQAHDLIAALFSRTASPIDRVVLVEERDPNDPDYEPLTWATACEQVPADAACLVIDSLETWANTYAEQVAFARAVYRHRASVKLVLAGTNAAGEVEGLARLRRVGDALVVLDASSWLVLKCRWLPDCPQRFARQRRNDSKEPPEDEEPPHALNEPAHPVPHPAEA
jgi:energy-coupling factor transporter ATP-binding protein EcfA2